LLVRTFYHFPLLAFLPFLPSFRRPFLRAGQGANFLRAISKFSLAACVRILLPVDGAKVRKFQGSSKFCPSNSADFQHKLREFVSAA
jgi:hypothetical protein